MYSALKINALLSESATNYANTFNYSAIHIVGIADISVKEIDKWLL